MLPRRAPEGAAAPYGGMAGYDEHLTKPIVPHELVACATLLRVHAGGPRGVA